MVWTEAIKMQKLAGISGNFPEGLKVMIYEVGL